MEGENGFDVPLWRPAPPRDEDRCEDVFDLTLGCTVGPDSDGREWVFIGWRTNSAGRNAWFARQVEGWEKGDPIFYSAAFADTLQRKLSGVERYRRKLAPE